MWVFQATSVLVDSAGWVGGNVDGPFKQFAFMEYCARSNQAD
jgi:hypothetical protein